ncbi:MAG: hypothetical protein KKG75_04045 [Nanoarchaeota archaeon]|nr:hypothetical protein [Nanoarchaeota archaeon]
MESLKNKEALFQGIFDGDGSYQIYNKSFTIDLALDPSSQIKKLLKEFSLVPTLAITKRREGIRYNNRLGSLYSIRLAPTSINKLDQSIFSASEVVNQLEFMINSARYSIRPDKVHKLIKIIKTISSKSYGENTNSITIQREIRNLVNKKKLKEKVKKLEEQYPIKNSKYLPFKPYWAKELCSKKEWFSEAWNFFFNLENINLKNYPNKEKFNFEEGIPIDFKLQNPYSTIKIL